MPSASIRITGDVKQALAAMETLGLKAEEEGKRTEHAFGSAASKTGNVFQNLGQTLGSWGVPFSSSVEKMGDKLEATHTKGQKAFQALSSVGGAALLGVATGAVAVGVESVKMASSFQSSAEHLVTDAGLAQGQLKGVESGMLAISSATGTTSGDIVNGMYHVQSALHLGANGLGVLRVAAEGAKVGGADLDTVSKTLTGTMASYYGSTLNAGNATTLATGMMNQLIATVGAGDMKMQDLASSLGNVTPVASAAGLSFAQVGGAIATMTSQNMSAQQATQDLSNLIRNLQAPNAVASKEMAQLGLNSNTVSKQLGQKGLTGTLGELVTAITSHMGPAGMVLTNAFNQSTGAAQDMQAELAKMPPAAKNIAQQFASGKMSVGEFRQEVKALPANQQAMLNGFISTYDQAHKFNQLLTSGSPAAQTFNAALEKMTGGATGLNTSLMLTGSNMPTFQTNVATVGAAAKDTGKHVDNWSQIQGTFAQRNAEAIVTVENLGVQLGLALIPKLQEAEKYGMQGVQWMEKHKGVAEALAGVIGGTLSIAIGAFVVNKLAKMVKGIADATKAVGGLISKMTGIGSGSIDSGGEKAAGALDGAASKLGTAAEQITAAAEKLASAGETAGKGIQSGAAAAEADMTAGGASAEADMAAGGATAESEMAAGGATAASEEEAGGAAGGIGGGGGLLGKAGMLGAAGFLSYEGTTKVLDDVFGKPKSVNTSTALTGNTKNFIASFMASHQAQIAANPQLSKWAKQGDTADILHYFNNQPASGTQIAIGTVNLQSQNPDDMSRQLQQKARLANLGGGSLRGN